jgi:hypothetical protein
VTGQDGNYCFTNLAKGSYEVKETNKLDVSLDVSDIDGGDPNLINVTIGGDKPLDSTGNNYVHEKGRETQGYVLEDNGGMEPIPIPGVLITLKNSMGQIVATTLTDSTGQFVLKGVPPGIYSLEQTNKPGYIDVSDSDGNDPNVILNVNVGSTDSNNNKFMDKLV